MSRIDTSGADSHELALLLGDNESPPTTPTENPTDLDVFASGNLDTPSQSTLKSRSNMKKWLSPFKRYKLEDFDSVYVPLDQAIRHPDVVAENKKRASAGILVDAGDGLTLESLRAEIEADITTSGHATAYDRKSKVVNKAIQDIGMGSYQWQLFVLCGFGWFADNLCESFEL